MVGLFSLTVATVAGLGWPSPQTEGNRGPTIGAAKVLIAQGDVDGAMDVLRELKNPEASFLLGRLLSDRGRWREARPLLEEALSDPSHRTDALRSLAQGSMQVEAWAEALGYLRELERADARDPKVLKALAVCHQKLGNSIDALAAVQRALVITPGDSELLTLMSEAAEASAMSAVRSRRPDIEPQPMRYGRR